MGGRSYSKEEKRVARKHCFMDISIDKDPIGRIEIELYSDQVPKTAENFRSGAIYY